MNRKQRRNALTALCAAGLLAFAAGCGQQQGSADYIGLDAAKAIALEDAGVDESAASFSITGLDRQNGTDFYAIDFTANGQSYAYDIDALTGNILNNGDGAGAAPASITEEQAREIALTHAGLSADQVTFLRCVADQEDGRQVYDVEFYTADFTEYDYEIAMDSGDILYYDFDVEGYDRPAPSAEPTPSAQTGTTSTAGRGGSSSGSASSGGTASSGGASGGATSGGSASNGSSGGATSGGGSSSAGTSTGITADQARQIALNHAGLSASQVTFLRSHLDWDDGRRVYDVEFYSTSNYTEYDYEIDASSGTVLSYDYDAEYYTPPSSGGNTGGGSGSSGATISLDQARQTALARVPGATANDVRIHLDYDDGRVEYEGTIYYNGTEYEFTIDAYSGVIREWDVESHQGWW